MELTALTSWLTILSLSMDRCISCQSLSSNCNIDLILCKQIIDPSLPAVVSTQSVQCWNGLGRKRVTPSISSNFILQIEFQIQMWSTLPTRRATILLTILLSTLTPSSSQPNPTQTPQIYGVRWFLGEHYQFDTTNIDDDNEYFILIFNSDQQIKGDLSVSIAKKKYSCLSKFITTEALQDHHTDLVKNGSAKGDVDQTYLHKCIIGNLQAIDSVKNNRTVRYQILLGDIKITQNLDIKSGGYKETVLFSEVFRMPIVNGNADILWIGDWGQVTSLGLSKGYFDVKPCMSQNIQNNPNIVMAFFLGDLAYDLQGPLYYSMLKYLEFITSKMVFMVTPGNHDTLYHADTFDLFVQSFYTTQWKQYSNYFYTLKVGKLAFVAYNPQRENFNFQGADRLQMNFNEVFKKELSNDVTTNMSKDYFPIVLSHYPIYCSKTNDSLLTCDKNTERLAFYRQYFSKMKMKLYFSGHVHVYQRTKPICPDGTFSMQNDNDTYNSSCPVYIVEGAGGNDIFIETTSQYPLKNYSKKLVYNSGFGILNVVTDTSGFPVNVTYRHYSAQKCNVSDQFTMTLPVITKATQEDTQSFQNYVSKILLKTALASFVISGTIFVALLIYKKCLKAKIEASNTSKKPQKGPQGHEEMVEQNIEGPNQNKTND